MKWPFVSRDASDAAFAQNKALASLAGDLKEQLDGERTRVEALTERLLSLKMAGAVEVPKEPERIGAAPATPVAPDEMRDLIHARAGTNYRKRAMMLAQLEIDRTAHVSDDTIRDAILNGVPSDGVPA